MMSRNGIILPNFLIIGAHKCGTTSLYEHLRQHPQVFMPQLKEPSFFSFEGLTLKSYPRIRRHVITRFEDYVALFQEARGKIAIGEASPMYLKCPQSARRIKHYIPDARLIVILRNPVDRAYSHFQMELRNGTVNNPDFMQSVQEMETLPDGRVCQRYICDGRYFSLLEPFYELFDVGNIQVLLFDHLRTDPFGILQSIYQFLKIDAAFVPDISKKYNEGGLWRNSLWGLFFRKIYPPIRDLTKLLPEKIRARLLVGASKLKNTAKEKPPDLSLAVRAELSALFRDDILKLQELIHQDLSDWL